MCGNKLTVKNNQIQNTHWFCICHKLFAHLIKLELCFRVSCNPVLSRLSLHCASQQCIVRCDAWLARDAAALVTVSPCFRDTVVSCFPTLMQAQLAKCDGGRERPHHARKNAPTSAFSYSSCSSLCLV